MEHPKQLMGTNCWGIATPTVSDAVQRAGNVSTYAIVNVEEKHWSVRLGRLHDCSTPVLHTPAVFRHRVFQNSVVNTKGWDPVTGSVLEPRVIYPQALRCKYFEPRSRRISPAPKLRRRTSLLNPSSSFRKRHLAKTLVPSLAA